MLKGVGNFSSYSLVFLHVYGALGLLIPLKFILGNCQ